HSKPRRQKRGGPRARAPPRRRTHSVDGPQRPLPPTRPGQACPASEAAPTTTKPGPPDTPASPHTPLSQATRSNTPTRNARSQPTHENQSANPTASHLKPARPDPATPSKALSPRPASTDPKARARRTSAAR